MMDWLKIESLCMLLLMGAVVANVPHRAHALSSQVINTFDTDSEGWRSYDYNGLPFGTEGGTNVFYPMSWESSGGVGDSGYIWSDHSRWRIDTPETPDSILAFIIYRNGPEVDAPNLDLRDAQVSVQVRGDDLDLKGDSVYFWIFSPSVGPAGRWHLNSQPLTVTEGAWGQSLNFTLANDQSLWHNSWNREGPVPTLEYVLGRVVSYGFSFVGFPLGEEVTGKFSMDNLIITVPEHTAGAALPIVIVAATRTLRRRHRGHDAAKMLLMVQR